MGKDQKTRPSAERWPGSNDDNEDDDNDNDNEDENDEDDNEDDNEDDEDDLPDKRRLPTAFIRAAIAKPAPVLVMKIIIIKDVIIIIVIRINVVISLGWAKSTTCHPSKSRFHVVHI